MQTERELVVPNLSKRLAAVASYVPAGARLLDVGSDHAYLPIALVEQGRLTSAIAGEVVKGPYESAVKNVALAGLSGKIAVRLADGLAAFTPADNISAITICGMGGRLIADILEAGQSKLNQVQRLILQPNNREDDLRQWLMSHQFQIVAETILVENDKFYELIVAEHGKYQLTDRDLRFGPYLRKERSAVFLAKWQKELGKLEMALSQIPENNQADRSAIIQRMTQIKEAIHGDC